MMGWDGWDGWDGMGWDRVMRRTRFAYIAHLHVFGACIGIQEVFIGVWWCGYNELRRATFFRQAE